MKVIQPFFLGGACGLVLALAIAIGLYASPLRKTLYLDTDPEIAGLRDRMDGIQERIHADEIGIVEAPAGSRLADSLKAAQVGAWKEYRHWRSRMGDLARMHERATPAGFAAWAYSLRYWILPAGGLMALLPALLLAVRGARWLKVPRVPKRVSSPVRKGGKPPARPASESHPSSSATRAEALFSFETAVKKVARIAEDREASLEKETEYLPEVPRRVPVPPSPPEAPSPLQDDEPAPPESSPYEVGSGNVFQEEQETAEFPPSDSEVIGDRPAGRETQILDLGPGWGESRRPPVEDPSQASRTAQGLSMEDEDGSDFQDLEEPPSGTFMPPTTEVERVERRKAEVVKLARKGLTSSEISRRMRISQDQVEFIIRMRREKG